MISNDKPISLDANSAVYEPYARAALPSCMIQYCHHHDAITMPYSVTVHRRGPVRRMA
jgi:hypothetical protein